MNLAAPPGKASSEDKTWPSYRLFLAAFCLLLATQSGSRPVNDGYAALVVAEGIADEGNWEYYPGYSPGYSVVGPDGKAYGKFGLGVSILMVPAIWVGKILSLGVDNPIHSALLQNLVLRVIPSLLGAATFFLLVLIGRRVLGLSATLSCLSAALAIVATPAWIYFRVFYAEGLLTLAFTGLIAMLAMNRNSSRALFPILLGVFAGLGLLAKPVGALLFPVAIAGLFWTTASRGQVWKKAVLFGVGALPMTGLALAYNWVRTGSLFGGTYTEGIDQFGFSTPLLEGLWGLLLSPGKGIVLYAPLVLLGCVAWCKEWKNPLVWVMGAFALPLFVISAVWWAWHGGECWGPRLVVPVLPVMALAWPVLVGRIRVWKPLAILAMTIGLSVQILGVLLPWQAYYERVPYTTWAESMHEAPQGSGLEALDKDNLKVIHQDWGHSPIRGHIWLLGQWIQGESTLASAPWDGEFHKPEVDFGVDWWVSWPVENRDWLGFSLFGLLLLASATFVVEGIRRGSTLRP